MPRMPQRFPRIDLSRLAPPKYPPELDMLPVPTLLKIGEDRARVQVFEKTERDLAAIAKGLGSTSPDEIKAREVIAYIKNVLAHDGAAPGSEKHRVLNRKAMALLECLDDGRSHELLKRWSARHTRNSNAPMHSTEDARTLLALGAIYLQSAYLAQGMHLKEQALSEVAGIAAKANVIPTRKGRPIGNAMIEEWQDTRLSAEQRATARDYGSTLTPEDIKAWLLVAVRAYGGPLTALATEPA